MTWFPQTDIEYAMQAEIDELRAENERLREALEKIAEHRLPFLKSSEIEIAEIASAALKGGKE
jgi:hypothetical protein